MNNRQYVAIEQLRNDWVNWYKPRLHEERENWREEARMVLAVMIAIDVLENAMGLRLSGVNLSGFWAMKVPVHPAYNYQKQSEVLTVCQDAIFQAVYNPDLTGERLYGYGPYTQEDSGE